MDKPLQEKIEDLYLNGYNIKRISELLKVEYHKVNNFIKKAGLEEIRRIRVVSNASLLRMAKLQLEKLYKEAEMNDYIPNADNMKMRRQLVEEIALFQDVPFGATVQIIQDVTEYLRDTIDTADLKKVNEYFDKYMANKYKHS